MLGIGEKKSIVARATGVCANDMVVGGRRIGVRGIKSTEAIVRDGG
jgi:hypothetical protein